MNTNIAALFFDKRKTIPDELSDYFNPDKVAVVELDMHRGHLGEEPDCPAPCIRGRQIIEPTNKFNAECRKLGIPIIHVISGYRAGDFENTRAAWRRIGTIMRRSLPAALTGGKNDYFHSLGIYGSKWCDLMVEVKKSDYIVNTKKRITAFETTDLDFLLRQLNKDVIVITGIMSDCCDLASGFYASSKDYKVLYIPEITRGFSDYTEEAAAKIFSLYIGLVVKPDELISEWAARRQKNS